MKSWGNLNKTKIYFSKTNQKNLTWLQNKTEGGMEKNQNQFEACKMLAEEGIKTER